MPKRREDLAGILASQGFGTRRECARLIFSGRVWLGRGSPDAAPGEIPGESWEKAADPDSSADTVGAWFRVDDLTLPYRDVLHLAFHKPPDCECSHAPSHHRSVFSYFPPPFLRRGLESAGRLDADTTGLLLLSDSGEFIHHLTSPKRHVTKTYRVDLRHPLSPEQISRLAAGVELRGEEKATLPARVEPESDRICRVSIAEGRYHQVKRMFAAVGNRVEAIHRIAIGPIGLEAGLAPGEWRFLSPDEVGSLLRAGKKETAAGADPNPADAGDRP